MLKFKRPTYLTYSRYSVNTDYLETQDFQIQKSDQNCRRSAVGDVIDFKL